MRVTDLSHVHASKQYTEAGRESNSSYAVHCAAAGEGDSPLKLFIPNINCCPKRVGPKSPLGDVNFPFNLSASVLP